MTATAERLDTTTTPGPRARAASCSRPRATPSCAPRPHATSPTSRCRARPRARRDHGRGPRRPRGPRTRPTSTGVIRAQRTLELAGRASLVFAKNPVMWVAGVGHALGRKIITRTWRSGTNVLHGQWDWMRDPDIHLHHLGVGLRHPGRVVEAHPQRPAPRVDQRRRQGPRRGLHDAARQRRPGVAAVEPRQPALQLSSRAGLRVGHRHLRPLELDEVKAGNKTKTELRRDLKAMGKKVARQFGKDYLATPAVAALTGSFGPALAGHAEPPTRSATSGRTR